MPLLSNYAHWSHLIRGVLVVLGDAQMRVLADLALGRRQLAEHELQQRRLARLLPHTHHQRVLPTPYSSLSPSLSPSLER